MSGTSDSLPAGSAEGWKQVTEAGRRRQTGLKGITGEEGRVREGRIKKEKKKKQKNNSDDAVGRFQRKEIG